MLDLPDKDPKIATKTRCERKQSQEERNGRRRKEPSAAPRETGWASGGPNPTVQGCRQQRFTASWRFGPKAKAKVWAGRPPPDAFPGRADGDRPAVSSLGLGCGPPGGLCVCPCSLLLIGPRSDRVTACPVTSCDPQDHLAGPLSRCRHTLRGWGTGLSSRNSAPAFWQE